MFNIPDSTRPDPVYPPRCRLQRLFSPRSISMYESASTSGRDELHFPRFKSGQSYKTYKSLSSPVSNLPILGSLKVCIPPSEKFHLILCALKARLSGAGVYHTSPLRDPTSTEMCREREPESRTCQCAPALRSSPAVSTSYQMSESYLGRRPLSPSFLDLTPSPGYQPPEYNSPSEYPPPSEYPSPSEYFSPSACCSPPATCVSTAPRTKRIKRKPPPLILSDSFHATGPQSSALAVPPIVDEPAPLTPLTPLTPISPQYRMPSEKEQFRRRLLKLQRTLGEQITPGLVIRPKPDPEPTAGPPDIYKENTTTFLRPRQRTGASLNPTSDYFQSTTMCASTDEDLIDLDSRFSRNLPVPFTHNTHNRMSNPLAPSSPSPHSPVAYLLPETVALTPMTLTAFVGSVNATPTARSFEFVLNCDVQDLSSEDDEDDEYPLAFSSDGDSCPSSPLQSDYACHSDEGDDIVLVDLPYLAPARNEPSSIPSTPGVKRKERRHGWSGEWNQAHIQDVIEKLRTL